MAEGLFIKRILRKFNCLFVLSIIINVFYLKIIEKQWLSEFEKKKYNFVDRRVFTRSACQGFHHHYCNNKKKIVGIWNAEGECKCDFYGGAVINTI